MVRYSSDFNVVFLLLSAEDYPGPYCSISPHHSPTCDVKSLLLLLRNFFPCSVLAPPILPSCDQVLVVAGILGDVVGRLVSTCISGLAISICVGAPSSSKTAYLLPWVSSIELSPFLFFIVIPVLLAAVVVDPFLFSAAPNEFVPIGTFPPWALVTEGIAYDLALLVACPDPGTTSTRH